jgi:hypothetical protein
VSSAKLGAGEAGIRVAVGVSGAGKTHGVRKQIYAAAEHMPVIVIDRMCEWSAVPARLSGRTQIVNSVFAAKGAISSGGVRLAIVQCKDAAKEAALACEWARDYPEIAGVAIPEAHRCAPNKGSLPQPIEDAACAWRHHRVALWLDTQRFALLSRTLVEQAREIRVYASGPRDVDAVVAELGGPELSDAIRECGDRLARGEPGWHVRLQQTSIRPPYVLEREPA